MIFKGKERIFENAIEELSSSTALNRKIKLIGVDSFINNSMYYNVPINIISLSNGVSGNNTLQINEDEAKPIYFLTNSGENNAISPNYDNWVYINQIYTVYYNPNIGGFICTPPNSMSGYSSISGGGEACFISDTLVLTDNGLKPIEDIKVNDLVMSYNFETKEQELKPVTTIISHTANYVYNITSENNIIKATGDHPVYSNEFGKINVAQLTPNCSLLLHNNIKDNIININLEEKQCIVYDISVKDNHTYYVGAKSALVYNENITNIYN